MKLPYGIADFEKIRVENYLYIDKTRFIEKIENLNSAYIFFIRPRRFGKSLFLSTLEHYYDTNAKDDFEKLFGDLYIGQNPTPLKNSYMVLRLNFSGLNAEDKHKLEKLFNLKIKSSIKSFLTTYEQYIKNIPDLISDIDSACQAETMLNFLIDAVKQADKKIYLIIDEYDNFANDIIAMGDGELYREIIRGSGFVRGFYKTVKIGTESVIDRIFITGVSPIMLDDLTSGFNIAMNMTMDETLNEMMGFTGEELDSIIRRLGINQERIGIKLKEYYNGYLFNIECTERVYNPDMILFYFDRLVRLNKQPSELIDENLKTDYGRLERLVANQENREMLERIIKEESVTTSIITKFSFDRMYDSDYFVSLLFYMGLLTIKGKKYGRTELTIPNYVIRIIFWEYFEKTLRNRYNVKYEIEELAKSIWQMGFEGRVKPFLDFIQEKVLKQLSNRDLIGFDEKYIKMIFFTYMVNSGIYRPVSEKEVENGYIDIYLERDTQSPQVKYEWIIELKYLKESERSKLEQVKEDGVRQLERYASSSSFVGRGDLRKVLVVFIGKSEYVIFDHLQ